MGFIRLKKRTLRGEPVYYAYIVKNEWDKKLKSPRQKVQKYLGKLIKPELVSDINFLEYINNKNTEEYLQKNSKNKIISDLINWELFRHGQTNITFKITSKSVMQNNKEVAIMMNNGYLCSYTVRQLLSIKINTDDERKAGQILAEKITEAGIKPPKEIFIGLFDKMVILIH